MIKSIDFCMQLEAERLPMASDTVIISITTEPGEVRLQPGYRDRLALDFYDLSPAHLAESKMTWEEAKARFKVFGNAEAQAVFDFVEKHHADPAPVKLLVHCEGGVSRSAAIALFFARRFQLPLKRDVREANRWVYWALTMLGCARRHTGAAEVGQVAA